MPPPWKRSRVHSPSSPGSARSRSMSVSPMPVALDENIERSRLAPSPERWSPEPSARRLKFLGKLGKFASKSAVSMRTASTAEQRSVRRGCSTRSKVNRVSPGLPRKGLERKHRQQRRRRCCSSSQAQVDNLAGPPSGPVKKDRVSPEPVPKVELCLQYGVRACWQRSCKRSHKCPYCNGSKCSNRAGYLEYHLGTMRTAKTIVDKGRKGNSAAPRATPKADNEHGRSHPALFIGADISAPWHRSRSLTGDNDDRKPAVKESRPHHHGRH